MSLIEFDKKFIGKLIGVDEVGRGCLAGPVVACAVIIKNYEDLPIFLNDSKKISAKKRDILYNYLTENCHFSISIIDNNKIDEINILQASLIAMGEAIKSLEIYQIDHIIIDGCHLPKIEIEANYHKIIKGDSLSASIAAASIIAKVTRDRIMRDLSIFHPEYEWDKNMGYGTKKHLEIIEKFGITTYHRKSFAPCKNYV